MSASLALETRPVSQTANRATTRPHDQRLRAVLLGCGTVNGGVLERLPDLADKVEIAAIVTRRSRTEIDPDRAWLTELGAAFDTGPDLVIEALPDCPAAEKALTCAAERGIHIVSANKAVFARRPDIADTAETNGAQTRFSAAVGGGVPVLETLQRLRDDGEEIVRVRGVLNGTSNYVLDLLEKGISREKAIRSAQAAGFAEADPSADIDGRDAAAKLNLIGRIAFDRNLALQHIPSDRLEQLKPEQVEIASQLGLRYRQCAEIRKRQGRIQASVRIEALPRDHVFCQARDEENAVEIQCRSGLKITLHGRGAGREPTASAMLSDIRALLRSVTV